MELVAINDDSIADNKIEDNESGRVPSISSLIFATVHIKDTSPFHKKLRVVCKRKKRAQS